MKQKPIKRNENILKFSKEHHFALLFSWKIRQGLKYNIAAERMQKYARYFWQHYMQPHFAEEEEILFAPMKDKWTQKAIEEHQQIIQQVKELENYTGDEANEKLSQLAVNLDNHVRYEERELFPHLEKTLSAIQLKKIGKQLQESQQATLQDNYEDGFWIKK